MTFFDKLIDFSLTWWYIISITIISGVNFRPKKCWAKVEQKSCEPKTRKNVIFRYTGSRKMSISDVIVVVEKKCDMFWRVDVMRSTQKKNHQNPSTNKKSAGGGQNHPPLVNHRIWKTLIYHGLKVWKWRYESRILGMLGKRNLKVWMWPKKIKICDTMLISWDVTYFFLNK